MENKLIRSLSILLLGTQIATGGAQKVLLDQARWFHARGYKVTAAFFYDRDGMHKKWQDVSPFQIVNLSNFQKKQGAYQSGLSILAGLFSLWQLIRREKIDVIETFTHDSNMLGLPIAWLARVPVRIATHHGVIEGFPLWRERLHAWMVNHNIAQMLVAVSERMHQIALLEGVKAERISVIQNGIQPMPFEGEHRLEVRKDAGIGADDPFLLSVGRLVHVKAHEVLVSAMPAVLKEFPNAKVGICGDGVLRGDLEAQIKSLGLEGAVKLFGEQNNVAKFLSSADVFILPSRSEGLPIALLEAMSAGLPVIATKLEGVGEVVLEGVHGLFAPVDNPEALAEVILKLLRDQDLREHIGAAAKQHVNESYSLDRMGKQYLNLIFTLLRLETSRH
ncbi:MAG: glycosyltransferase family 4 protein [Chloroflexi bacterium]|nr:glycosyltransferase family 4 protein [Chloroflexota bacterium]